MALRWTLTDLIPPYGGIEVLTKDPIGWEDGIYTIKRSNEYRGVFHEYSTTLKFHCDGGGKDYIDNVYQNEDINGRIGVLVEYDCDGSGTYDELFTGVINLASYKTDGEYTWANIETATSLTKLFNRDKINVDLQSTVSVGGDIITAPNIYNLHMPGMDILLENIYDISTNTSYEIFYNMDNAGAPLGLKDYRIRPTITLSASSLGGIDAPVSEDQNSTDSEVLPIYNYIMDSALTPSPLTVNYDIKITGQFLDKQGTSACADTHEHCHNMRFILAYGDDWATRTEVVIHDFDTTPGDNNVYTVNNNAIKTYAFGAGGGSPITATGTITLLDGQYVWFYFWHEAEAYADITSPCIGSGPFFISRDISLALTNNTYINLNVDTTFPDTNANTILVHEALTQVVDSITDSDNNFYSDFYGRTDSQKRTYSADGCGSALAITNGLNIRAFPNKKIYCNLNELFNSLDALHNIGLGYVDGLIRIEPISYWFDGTTQIISLPNVNKYEKRNDNTRYFNKIQIGYQKWETEIRGGLDEPCTKHEYSTKIMATDGEYNKLSKYISSSYAIELTRRKNISFQSDLEDWMYDNENFFIALVKTASGYIDDYLVEKRIDAFSSATGMVAAETAYNLRLTPTRMLLAHIGSISACLQLINGYIKFVRGDGNTDLETTKFNTGCQEDYGGYVLGENDSIAWNDANAMNIAPIWGTEIYSFEYPLTYTEFKTIKANPYGYVSFYKNADDVKHGFILNMEYKMKTGMTKFELLKKA